MLNTIGLVSLSPGAMLALLGTAGTVISLVVLLTIVSRFLHKAAPGEALVKSGFGMTVPKISLGSMVAIPLLHKLEKVDLTVKTIRIERRQKDSLSCADGIRAEVEVDFYIKINSIDEDIRHVATTVGAQRATHIDQLRVLFEAKFADALKTAGSKLNFDQLYTNRKEFRDEILKALGGDGNHEVVLNGYRLDDVAIQYLEQLPLDMHDANNVLDAKGRKVIAMRTSTEAEAANQRLREREVTIAEQDREAEIRQLQISQEIAEKKAAQEREIKEAQSREESMAEQTMAEQEKLAEEARIRKDQGIIVAGIERDKTTRVADEQKQQEVEIAQRNKEMAIADAEKLKMKKLEELSQAEGEKLRAQEAAETVRALEEANRKKAIDVIQAEKEARVIAEKQKVEYDVLAYELKTVAQAKLEAAQLDAQSAEKRAMALLTVGEAEANTHKMLLDAKNTINNKAILEAALSKLIPMLPDIIEKLMLPAEKIDSIKILNIGGMENISGGNGGNGVGASSPGSSVMNTVLGAGMALPLLKEVMGLLKGSGGEDELSKTLKEIPGGEKILQYLDTGSSEKPGKESPKK